MTPLEPAAAVPARAILLHTDHAALDAPGAGRQTRRRPARTTGPVPAAGGDVDMVDQGAAAPDPEVPTGVSLSKAQNESLANMAGERKHQLLQMKTAAEMDKMQPPLKKGCVEAALLLRGHKPVRITYGSARA